MSAVSVLKRGRSPESNKNKRPRQDESQTQLVTFMYLGVYKFLRFCAKVQVGDHLPKKLTENEVDQVINHDDLPIWKNFKKELCEDNANFFDSFKNSYLRDNEGVKNDYFFLHQHNYYIYCYKKYQRSSDSKWQFWRQIFMVQGGVNMTASTLNFKPCSLNHNCSLTLLPYFWDNQAMEEYLQECSRVPKASELKGVLVMAKEKEEKQGIFAYKEEFDEEGGLWDENVWSKRLAACLKKFILEDPYTVEYTGDKGNRIYTNRLLYHRFHGAPDMVIRMNQDERGVATVLATEESSYSDTDDPGTPAVPSLQRQGTTVATVENSVQVEGKFKEDEKFMDPLLRKVILEKSGELLANMHISLVDKMLKEKRLLDMNIEKLKIAGILISRPSGISLFTYEMPVVKAEDLSTRSRESFAKLTLQTKLNSIIPENICVAVRKLLDV
ncbi:uncharacterized protein [Dysidea avara]|uniref:uncharacterized protein n=1 Tax=Dysidea avara TaxID=196820 RepID=UPI00331EF618